MAVLIDNRETPLTIHNGVQEFGLENIRVETLLTGDVLLNEICIERKTPEDLINSKISPDKHLDTQCKRMTAYPRRVLVIDGNFKQLIKNNSRYSRYNLDWYHGVLASVQVNYGISIKEVDNNKEFWNYVGKLHYKAERKKDVELSPIYTPKITKKNKSVYLSQLCCIPTVSENKALRIKERFGNTRELCNATLEELQTIDGIGPKLAQRIKSEYF